MTPGAAGPHGGHLSGGQAKDIPAARKPFKERK